jgi:hypothetical protein
VANLAGRAAAHPDQAEVAHRRAPGLLFSFDLKDFVAAPHGLPCVHRPEHASTDDHHSHTSNVPWTRAVTVSLFLPDRDAGSPQTAESTP